MDKDRLIKVMGQIANTIKLHKQAAETMHKLVFALAKEHLKQNQIKQTVSEWLETTNALEYLLYKKPYTGEGVGFLHRRLWPTHLRIKDFKPVRVKPIENATNPTDLRVCTPRGRTLDFITKDVLESEFLELNHLNS